MSEVLVKEKPTSSGLLNITFGDLSTHAGEVLLADRIEIFRGRPENGQIAGIWLPDGDGPGMVRVVLVTYHYGRGQWCMLIEHSIQKANEYRFGALPDVIGWFEEEVGETLPDIKVIEYGIGVYGVKTRFQSENPFALKDGGFYTVACRRRGRRTFVADVRNGRTLINFFESDDSISESFEPALLSMDDWRSLRPAD